MGRYEVLHLFDTPNLPNFGAEFDNLYPESLVSRELACGSLSLIQRIGNGGLPILFSDAEWLEWGRYIRSSPQSSQALLQELRQFDPPWDVFEEWDTHLWPNEFHDVVKWLKAGHWAFLAVVKESLTTTQASPDPQLDLIGRWQGYLAESIDRSERKYSDDELKERWHESIEQVGSAWQS
ncbi:hypothetical protein B0H17DRAFT_1150342 [Mycena rosella]|uniref:Uncharacterized protein n=1 Tax=Mycena rosella TaxID=1033263 RepID=A0AAD7BT82_MYCRO|nr:hypothetical protein B0H17DRAFT_1150342 [Mycena rosella]